MGIFSTSHIILIGIVALLLFGNRLPQVMRSLGTGINEFKRGLEDVNRQITQETSPAEHKEPVKD